MFVISGWRPIPLVVLSGEGRESTPSLMKKSMMSEPA